MNDDDDLDRIHMHDMTGEILSGAEMMRVLRQMAGGDPVSDKDIEVRGTKIVIPERMSPLQVIVALFAKWVNDEEVTAFERTVRYRPYDGAYAANQVLHETFGFVDGQATQSMWGEIPPSMVTVNIGLNQTAQIPWGALSVAALGGATVNFMETEHPEWGTVFRIEVKARRKYGEMIEALFAAIEERLREQSIYRGKAIKAVGGTEPVFMDLSTVDSNRVVYSEPVRRMLDANLWLPMRAPNTIRALKMTLRQYILVYGPFGTGKTLVGHLSGQVAVANNFTAIYAESGDDIQELLELAELYAPAFVFYEDLDKVAAVDSDGIDAILDAFDGVSAKGKDVIAVFTTNKRDALAGGMRRPGRIDVMIPIGLLDAECVEQVIKANVLAELLGGEDSDIDYGVIANAMTGFTPAFITQTIERAQKYALLREGGSTNFQLTTDDFVNAALEVREQFEFMNQPPDERGPRPLDSALMSMFDERLAAALSRLRVTRSGQLELAESSANGTGS